MTEPLYCANHPKVETSLRCNRCEKPICAKCAVHMDTGYRCKECVKAQRKQFETAVWIDYFLGFFTALILSGIGATIVVFFLANIWYGFWTLLFAPFATKIIVNLTKKLTRYHYSRNLFLTISAGVLLGGLPLVLRGISGLFLVFSNIEYYGGMNWLYLSLPLIWVIIYLFITVPAVYAGLTGISLK